MDRAMNVLQDQNVQLNPYYHDHPFFGQVLLAGMLAATGFPDSLNPSAMAESIESLYLVPKIWMGILAVIDTFLVYKIAQSRYDSRIALFASILFAVMPVTWLTRRILLESLLLPFLLSSILFALWAQRTGNLRSLLLMLSGVCLGLAIFTKIPAFTIIPLVGFLIYSGSNKNKQKNIGMWLIPVILIPLLWPAYTISTNTFDGWVDGIIRQTQRQSEGISTVFYSFLNIDPILLSLGIFGFGYAAFKKDGFVLLWIGPFLVFLWLIGYVQYFHVLPMLPIFCISAAKWTLDLAGKIKTRSQIVQNAIMTSVGLFGLICTTLLITTNMTSAQFEGAAFALKIADKDTTIVASPVYSWLFKSVFHMPYALNDYRDILFSEIPTDKVVLVSDLHFRGSLHEARIEELYNSTTSVRTFYGNANNYDAYSYPYTSLQMNYQGNTIDLRLRMP